MIIRDLGLSDLAPIDEMWQRCHKGVNGIAERKFVVTDAVVENGKLTGYGVVRFFAEASLYIDKDISRFQQAKTFKLLMEKAIKDCKSASLDALNVVVVDPSFEDLLRKRYDFKERGKLLTLGV